MKTGSASVLTINGGSSSIRFAVYAVGAPLRLELGGKIERIGHSGATLIIDAPSETRQRLPRKAAVNHLAAVDFLLDWLESQPIFSTIKAVGHRVVHGMKRSQPQRITPEAALRAAPDYPVCARASAARARADRDADSTASALAAGGLFRHRVSSHDAAGWRSCCRSRGAMRRRESSATAFTGCPMPILMEELAAAGSRGGAEGG